ncbi:unnamed protein product [Adineta steineri]|uniref:2-amino-3-ketobutyrate coenzyme A ligase, mitochondrial n=2 Tax=Adineta steineri TaxID=433720 RepID=A0A814CR39_9BILA|nr:unnamed protein product [Adineta steineri]
MISKKVYLVLQLLFLIYLFHISNGLECKVCQKNDPNCSLGENVETRKCENDNDYCFSWFDRKGSVVGTERDCISSDTPEYEAIKEIIGNKNNGCAKSVNSLDCFKFCSVDNFEQRIAKFHQREDAILYISCFDANAGIFETLLKEHDYIISDELNHASIIDGIRLCKAKRLRYKHKDMSDLEAKLKESLNGKDENAIRLIATDGVFSMDGTIAPLPDIKRLADKYKALVFVDECHATGFFGPTGRGTEEHFGMTGQIDIINSTLGKALGGAAGGYTTGPKALIDLLRQRSRPYLFSNTLPPAIVGSAMKAIDLIESDTSLPGRVLENAKYFREEMQALGFKILGDAHPICPVMLGDARLASQFADEMLKRDIYVIGFSFPVVPKDRARIRVQVSAAHSKADLKRCIDAFAQVGRQLKVIK